MMATYFHGGSEIQAAGGDHNLQTLYLMNPNFISAYSEAQTPPNMLFLNPPNALSQGNLSHAPPSQQQQFIGIPLSAAGGPHPSDDHSRPSPSSSGSQQLQHQHHHHHHNQIPAALHGVSVSRVHPNLWSPNHPGPIQSTASGPDMAEQMGFRRPMTAQGLSLSLSPGQQQNQSQVTLAGVSSTSLAASSGVIFGSKYLKAAQEVLEEVVNVGTNNGNNNGDNRIGESSGAHKEKAKAVTATTREQSSVGEVASRGGNGGGEGESSISGGSKKVAELSTAQRQELQMKKAKLINMLDEVLLLLLLLHLFPQHKFREFLFRLY